MSERSSKRPAIPWRYWLGEEHYLVMLRDYEAIRARRNAFQGKPDQYDRALMALDKQFEQFYKCFVK
jgi:hypothetical protein